MRRLIALLTAAAALSASAACSQDPGPRAASGPPVRLDGSARIPDDEGVATALDRESITLDGERTYRVSDQLRSFSTYTRELEPMLGRRGQYVQIGVDDGSMVWMAGISRLVDVDGRPSAYYTGTFRGQERGRFVFEDGTTFAVVRRLEAPPEGSAVSARIDVGTRRIVELE
ncbi:MAG TPA: hypothetical protein VM933_03800 [Acidimicrobiales bacterium]|nr:hypothetical protein [Acidimicrobiales bacterium]